MSKQIMWTTSAQRAAAARILAIFVPAILTSCSPSPPLQEPSTASRPEPAAKIVDEPQSLGLVGAAIAEITSTLALADDVQKELFYLASKSGPKNVGAPSSLSMVLLMPYKKEVVQRQDFIWRNPGQRFFIKMTKISSKATIYPSAIITYTDTIDGNLSISEKILFLDPVRGWHDRIDMGLERGVPAGP
jgi:hypothetical protein